MSVINAVLEHLKGALEALAIKSREAYLAQVRDLPESERQIGHRGMFLP